jgi:hypothetical protein
MQHSHSEYFLQCLHHHALHPGKFNVPVEYIRHLPYQDVAFPNHFYWLPFFQLLGKRMYTRDRVYSCTQFHPLLYSIRQLDPRIAERPYLYPWKGSAGSLDPLRAPGHGIRLRLWFHSSL